MGPSNSSFLSFRVAFHFHDFGRKNSPKNNTQKDWKKKLDDDWDESRSFCGFGRFSQHRKAPKNRTKKRKASGPWTPVKLNMEFPKIRLVQKVFDLFFRCFPCQKISGVGSIATIFRDLPSPPKKKSSSEGRQRIANARWGADRGLEEDFMKSCHWGLYKYWASIPDGPLPTIVINGAKMDPL